MARPCFVCDVKADERGNWLVSVPAAPDLGPLNIASSRSRTVVARLVRECIADHFDIPAQSFGLDLGRW